MGGDGDDTRDDGNADRKPLNMTLAAIIVSVDFDQGSEARISLAAALAVRFNSLLIGVALRAYICRYCRHDMRLTVWADT